MRTLRQNLNIIFIGVSAADSEPFISLLRSARLAPRAELAEDSHKLESLLGQRQWDMIIYTQDSNPTLSELCQTLKTLKRDIPLVILAPDNAPAHRVDGLKAQASAVVPIQEKELLVLTIRRELYHLENRRRRRQADAYLLEADKRCRSLLESSAEAIAYLNKENQFIYINPAFLELIGFDNSSELLGDPILRLTQGNDTDSLSSCLEAFHGDKSLDQEIEVTVQRKDYSHFIGNFTFSWTRFDRTPCTQVSLSTPYDGAEADNQAENDLVTGLKNQVHFGKRLDRALQAARHGDAGSNLLFLSLDNFNTIKAEIGVNGIDAVVRDVADILQELVNRAHVLTRFSLSSFTIIFNDPDTSKAVELAEKICKAVESNISRASETNIQTSCSIGITAITDQCSSAHEVLQQAQLAAEGVNSKNQRGNGVNVLTPESKEEEEGLSIQKLREAIEGNNLKLLFQPVVSLQGGHDSIYEVLLRLIDQDNNEVSPNMFLTILDHAEVSLQLDRWVIAESIRQLAEEHRQGRKNRLFINVTGRSLEDPSLLPWISGLLRKHDVPGNSLIFQFSESDASSYIKYANIFTQGLMQLHASACIKHYGSSIDSDNVLHHIPADYVKLDGSFVQELSDKEKHEAFDKLIEPLRAGNKQIVAPLVEGTNVMSKLFVSGVHLIQGYYLQAPREKMDYDFFNDA